MNTTLRRGRFLAGLAAASAASACGGGNGASLPAPTIGGVPGTLYVADSTPALLAFPLPMLQGGNEAPALRIAGPNDTLTAPYAIAHDPSGSVYVSETTSTTINVFSGATGGNVAPQRTIGGSATLIQAASPLALEPSGALLVAVTLASGGGAILRFASGATGNVAPSAMIAGPATTLVAPNALAVGSDGTIVVTEASGGLKVFAPGASGNVAPARTPGDTSVIPPIAVDADGTIYAVAAQRLVTFASSAGTGSPPTSTVRLNFLGATNPVLRQIAVDAANLYVVVVNLAAVYVFAKGTLDGNPLALLSGANTTLATPLAVAR
ncbi:MAG: hypothetical protein JO103_07185 [Candidatus Eremiobacteraeota bacterium]|nr:hypothetical protein [Candidatus Eremiobacteraeota bacterium]MBV9409682.1 hypothetical protein [Candidatus Eremiobacteraeota bacterium]